MKKQEAREYGKTQRRLLSSLEKETKAHSIYEQLIPEMKKADSIGCYVSFKDEVSTKEIINYCLQSHKTICVPKVYGNTLQFYAIQSWQDLQEGSFHLLEPISTQIIDLHRINLMIVPLVAFDAYNNRCGYGRGFYDSVLQTCKRKVGIAYKEQKVDSIECDSWDVVLDRIYCA